MKRPTVWTTQHKTDEERKKFLGHVETTLNTEAIKQLRFILQSKYQDFTTDVDYTCPSWAHQQAHMNGYRQALSEVLHLIKVE